MRRLALVAVAFVLCTACKLSITVGVDARADGSGVVRATVVLDKEAADRLQRAGSGLAADDLKQAGWTVDGPTKLDGGGAQIVATKPFNTPAELSHVIDEVAGARHPLRDFHLTRTRTFLHTKTRFSGVVDLSGGINAFGDDRLKQQTGADVGLDQADLERQANVTLNRFFSIGVAARLPGSVSSNAPQSADNGAVWHPKLGERAELTASASQLDTKRLVGLVIALGTAVALVAVLRQRVAGRPSV